MMFCVLNVLKNLPIIYNLFIWNNKSICDNLNILQAEVYTDSSGGCAAFISNVDDKNDKTVEFRNTSYHVPAWSVSILPDCKNVVFNTAKV